MAYFGLAPDFRTVPQQQHPYDGTTPNGYFDDRDHVWQYLLQAPVVGTKEGSCVRGVTFVSTALQPTQLNVDEVYGLVLDVDEFGEHPIPLDRAAEFFARALFGVRHVVWTTYNSTFDSPRYRLVIPLAQPLGRRKFRALWECVNRDLGQVVGEGQWNANRLGYLPRLPSEAARAHYYWWICQGPLLDAEQRYGTLDEAPDRIALQDVASNVVDRTNWLTDDEAIGKARAYLREAHVGVNPGSRHFKLFEKACQLWWDFYLPPEQVTTLLREVNARFVQPKSDIDVLKEVEAGFAWTRGPAARPQTGAAGFRRCRPDPVTLGKLNDLGTRLRRRQGQRELGEALVKLAAREAFASHEEALPISRSLARLLAEQYPQADPDQIARLFASSLSLMQAQAGPAWPTALTAQVIADVCRARQHEIRSAKQRDEQESQREQSRRISQAFGNQRTLPYTVDEFAEIARQQRCTVEEMRKRLIIQSGPSFFFLLGNTYSPPIEHGAEEYAYNALAAAEPLGVDLHFVNKMGEVKRRKLKDLVVDYGVVAEKLSVDLAAPWSYYDGDTKTMHYAVCPLRRIQPERVPEIEHYLSLWQSESVLDWLAYLPRLDRPAKAIYMIGGAGVGKSFFALCLSRLWSTGGPSRADDLLGDFNQGVTSCPLVFFDEQLPLELRGRKGTERLRYEIQSTTRPYKAKFRSSAALIGSLRFVLAANHERMVQTDDALTTHDVDGIRQRLEPVLVPEAAGEYLRSLGMERTQRWLDDDLFAKHVLWLRDTRDLPHVGRFGPDRVDEVRSPTVRRVHDTLRFSGPTGDVLSWVYGAVVGDGAPPPGSILWGHVGDDVYLLLNLEAVQQYWTLILPHVRPLPRPSMRDAFKALRVAKTRVRENGKRLRYHAISPSALTNWMNVSEADTLHFNERCAALIQRGVREIQLDADDDE